MTILYLLLVLEAISVAAALGFFLACAVHLIIDKVEEVYPALRLSFALCFPLVLIAVGSVLITWATVMTSLVLADSGVAVAVVLWASMFLLGGFAILVPLVVAMFIWLLLESDGVKPFDQFFSASTFSIK